MKEDEEKIEVNKEAVDVAEETAEEATEGTSEGVTEEATEETTLGKKKGGKKIPKKKIILYVAGGVVLAFVIAALIFALGYYKADETAMAALESDGEVAVSKTDYGYYFDGPENDEALIFYPGAKVDERAYAPMLRELANAGIDVCLIKTPFHLAVLRPNAADDVMAQYDYDTWYVGGHSMGGAIASMYAEKHASSVDAVIMLAAYPTGQMPDNQIDIVIYGENDGVLELDKVEEGRDLVSGPYYENMIIGGNHANFGYYGNQLRDGKADISAKIQQDETVRYILDALENERGKENGN